MVLTISRWLFYPPHVRPPGVKVSITEEGDQDVDSLSPISWVLEVIQLQNIFFGLPAMTFRP